MPTRSTVTSRRARHGCRRLRPEAASHANRRESPGHIPENSRQLRGRLGSVGAGGGGEKFELLLGPRVGELETEVPGRFARDEVVEELEGAHEGGLPGVIWRACSL